MPILQRLSVSDGSWQAFEDDWRRQCEIFEEDLANFAVAHFSMLREAATNEPKSGAFALQRSSEYAAACQLNCSPLPSFQGPVLRLRFLTLSPRYDIEGDEEAYTDILLNLLQGVLEISDDMWPADHVKFHLASPADRGFFAALGKPLSGTGVFEKVCVKGSWLYISKIKP